MNIFKFSGRVVWRVMQIMWRRKVEAARGERLLSELEEQYGGRLPGSVRRKVIVSYSIYQPMIIDTFCALNDRLCSEEEKQRILYYFICSSTFDDFIDHAELTLEELQTISFKSPDFHPRNIQEQLFLHCHQELLDLVNDRVAYDEASKKLYKVQVESLAQFESEPLSGETLLRITLEKGGYAVLLCCYYLQQKACDAERECWYLLGGIIQLTNDLFDTWKDLQAGQQTLPNRATNAYEIKNLLSEKVAALQAAIASLDVPASRKDAFLLNMMAICSFSDMAIQQLCDIQGEQGALPDLNSLARKELIVDMEKPRNIWHCLVFTWRQCHIGRQAYKLKSVFPG